MVPRSVLYTITLFLFLLLHPFPSQAHNRAVALVVPVEGITIDGNLSDWPAHVHWEYIELLSSFFMPLGPTDLTGRFATGYAVASNTLYVALDVRDDEMALSLSASIPVAIVSSGALTYRAGRESVICEPGPCWD